MHNLFIYCFCVLFCACNPFQDTESITYSDLLDIDLPDAENSRSIDKILPRLSRYETIFYGKIKGTKQYATQVNDVLISIDDITPFVGESKTGRCSELYMILVIDKEAPMEAVFAIHDQLKEANQRKVIVACKSSFFSKDEQGFLRMLHPKTQEMEDFKKQVELLWQYNESLCPQNFVK